MARAGQGCKVSRVWWRRPEPQVPFNRIEVVNQSDGGFFPWERTDLVEDLKAALA